MGSIETTEPEDFDRLINVNVRSVYLVTRAFLPLLLAARDHHEAVGTIVNIASVAGLVGIKQRFAYCTTKGAIVAMTRQLAVEYPKTLRVNAVCPGTVQTPFVEGYLEKFHKHNKEEMRAELRARQPVGRLGRPEEVPLHPLSRLRRSRIHQRIVVHHRWRLDRRITQAHSAIPLHLSEVIYEACFVLRCRRHTAPGALVEEAGLVVDLTALGFLRQPLRHLCRHHLDRSSPAPIPATN